jgi:phenylpropionate dioxygenase-like ring-hydroxylating dioxygenase large terminal subunit
MEASHVTHWTEAHPELDRTPLPIARLMSPEFFELERERIFRRCWLKAAREEELPRPGDFVVRDLPVCNVSILLMRGKDGQVRGFYNVCLHRGNRLSREPHGRRESGLMTCKFHGWSYDSSGRLVGVPDEENFFNLNKQAHGLKPVATETWNGFVFINLEPHPRQTLRDYLGAVTSEVEGYPFSEIPFSFGYAEDLRCNWKLCVDAQIEGYHVAFLHRRSLGDVHLGDVNPFCHPLEVSLFGPHLRGSFPGYGNWSTPVRDITARVENRWSMGRLFSFADFGSFPRGLNPTRSENWAFDVYFIFPNLWMGLFNGFYFTHEMWPTALGMTRQETRMYQPLPRTHSERFTWEYQKALNRDVWLEDLSTLESTWEGVNSGVITEYVLQDNEVLLRSFYRSVERMVDGN